jgi:hypothetical protein
MRLRGADWNDALDMASVKGESVAFTAAYAGSMSMLSSMIRACGREKITVFEELAMRGIVLGELLPFGKSFAVIASGALFALMHMNPVQLPFAFIAGTAMAYAALSCGTLRVSVTVHFINNFLSVLFLSLPEFLSPEISFIAELSVSVVIFAAGTAAGVYLIRHRRDEDAGKTALCTVTDEPLKVDLRDGLHGKISPLLVIYACTAVLVTLLTFGLSLLTPLFRMI